MSYRSWKSLRAEEVYIYPSANSDDGGDVNSEHNLAEITYKMIYKNFVVCHQGDIVKDSQGNLISAPLMVSVHENNKIRISGGTAVIEGYLIRMYPLNNQYVTYNIDSSLISDIDSFIAESNRIYNILYDNQGNRRILSPEEIESLGFSDLPRMHVVLKLIKNSTGNVRGDMYKRENNSVIRVNKGLALSVLNDEELSSLDVPYLVIGDLYYMNCTWYSEENWDKYQYISETMIISPIIGMTFQEWVLQQIYNKLKKLDTITKMTLQSNGAYDVNLDLSVRDGSVIVTRYVRDPSNLLEEDTIMGEKTGDVVYKFTPVNGPNDYDSSYSIDDIQRRSHPSSKIGDTVSSNEDNRVAKLIDSLTDTGNGYHSVWLGESKTGYVKNSLLGKDGFLTENGVSRLVSRADHRHDKRYLLSANAWASGSEVQFIGTTVQFLEKLFNMNGNNYSWYIESNGDASFKSLLISGSLTIGGGLVVKGDTDLQGNVILGRSGKTLIVNSVSTFNESVTFNEDVVFDKDITVNGFSEMNGMHSTDGLFDKLTVKKDNNTYFSVTPSSNSSNATIVINAGSAGSITITGPTTFNSKVNFNQGIEVDGGTKTNTLTVTGDSTIGGDLTVTGVIRGSKVYGAVWNDYAELYLKDIPEEDIVPGTIISKVEGRNTYSTCGTEDSSRKLVVGVVSDNYGHLLGGDKDLSLEDNLKKYVPVALSGRVYVRVHKNCRIKEGDLLSPSRVEPGIATNLLYENGTMIGKALESSSGDKDKILMQVFLS